MSELGNRPVKVKGDQLQKRHLISENFRSARKRTNPTILKTKVCAQNQTSIRVTGTRGAPQTATKTSDPAQQSTANIRASYHGKVPGRAPICSYVQQRTTIIGNIPPQILMLLPRTCRRIGSIRPGDFETIEKIQVVRKLVDWQNEKRSIRPFERLSVSDYQ